MKKLLWIVLILVLVACGATDGNISDDAGTTAQPTAETAQEATSQPQSTQPSAIETADGMAISGNLTEASQIRPNDHVKGAETATITLIEYADFQCPGCAGLHPMLAQLTATYPNDVRLVFRHFPLITIHDNAQKAAEAAEAAGAQGKFWEYHDLLFEKQSEFARADQAQARDLFVQYATELGLDSEKFAADLDDGVYADLVKTSMDEATALGMPGTPSVIFNGELWTGQQIPPSYFYWDAIVRLELLQAKQYAAAPAMTIDPNGSYVARVKLSNGGEFVIELLPQSAPQTVNSFVFLAQEGWFDGVTFHRVLPDFVAQTGDPTGTGFGGPGYTIPNEIDAALSHKEEGVVAMANSGADTNGSQWYITLGDASFLDGGYTIFGRVIEGMDVVKALTPRDPSVNPELPAGDQIESVTIEVGE